MYISINFSETGIWRKELNVQWFLRAYKKLKISKNIYLITSYKVLKEPMSQRYESFQFQSFTCYESEFFEQVIHCLNLAMEEKFSAMEQVAHQCICMQYLLELAKQLDLDPRTCISSFFTKYELLDFWRTGLAIQGSVL